MFDPSQPYVTSGPFELTDWVNGEFYELSANPAFSYYPEWEIDPDTDSNTTPVNGDSNSFTLVVLGGAIGAAAVVFVGGFILIRKK